METVTPDTSASSPARDIRSPTQDRAKVERAARRLAAIKGFYIHLFVFAVVLAGLFVINAMSGGRWWVLLVLLGWGIGVVAHALAVFGRAPRIVADWEKRKLKQLVNER